MIIFSRRQILKKKFLIFVLFISSFMLFAEGSFNLKLGMDVTSSFSFKPYLGANISVDYSWESGFGLGIGFKEYCNVIRDKHEKRFFGGPYGIIKYKNFLTGAGFLFIEGLGELTYYLNIGGALPLWEMKKGKLGLDFGLEAWFPPATYIPEDDDSNTNSNAPMGCIAVDPSTIMSRYTWKDGFEVYVGVTYFLPL